MNTGYCPAKILPAAKRATMRTVELATSGLRASRLGFGLSGLHHLLRSRDRQALLASAFDNGISYFDTSPYYGHGLAERELGLFSAGRRQQVVIATKFGIPANPWLRRLPLLMYSRLAANAALRRMTRRRSFAVRRSYDYRAASLVKSVDRSLRTLRTDHVDILYLHDPTLDRLTEPAQLIETLHGLKTQGKLRHFGLAGSPRDCLSIMQRYPQHGWMLQLDAALGTAELELLDAQSRPFQSSYGHFRGRQEPIATLLARSVRANRNGIILFSTRRAARISAMVDLLSALEPV